MSAARRIDVAAFLAAGAGVVLVASDQGGFFARTWPWAGLYFAAAGALALVYARDLRVTAPGLTLICATAALTAWTALSWFWSSEPSTSLHEAARTPIYLAAAVAFVTLAAAGGSFGLVAGVAGGTTLIAAYSLGDRVLNGVPHGDLEGGLLQVPLGYANALGALCGIGLVIVVAIGVDLRRNARTLAISSAAAAVLLVALALTDSRGTWLAVTAGGLVGLAAALGGRRWATGAALVVAALGTGLAVLTVFSRPDRLQARGDYWHAAWHAAARHPLGGTGAGTFDLTWAAYGDLARWGGAVDAHNLYLETLSELGLIGLVLLAGLVVPAVSAMRRHRPAATTTAALAGAVTYLVHAGLDWDWEMPAVTTAGIACLAACLDRGESAPATGRGTKITLFAVAIATIIGYVLYAFFR